MFHKDAKIHKEMNENEISKIIIGKGIPLPVKNALQYVEEELNEYF